MPTNQFGQYYSGNDDFRGYLAGQNSILVPYVGNDGGVDGNRLTANAFKLQMAGVDPTTVRQSVADTYGQWSAARQPQSGDTTYTAPNYSQINANTISQLSQGLGTVNSALNRLPGQLDIANSNINKRYGQRNQELTSGYNQSKNVYDTSTTQNQQSFRTNKNSINDQASGGLRGLLRMLGSYGAVGSDLTLAGRAVQDQASRQNAGAGLNYATNQSGLDTNWGNFENSFKNEKKKLTDWRTEQLANAEQQSTTTRQDLLSKLADINGQIAAARGGSYAGAAQPYLDQANALSSRIDALGKLNPTYDGVTPVYTAPSLSSYNVRNPVSYGLPTNSTAAADAPYLSLLLGKDDKNKQPVAG